MPYSHSLKFYFLLIFSFFKFLVEAQNEFCRLQPTQNIYWNSLTGNNGLSQNSVTSILQDHKGFIWIGTYDGLNRFDGFTTEVKRHEYGNTNSLSDNRVLCLTEDRNKNILIGTEGGGLNIFDPAKETVTPLPLQNGNIQNNSLLSLCTDSDGNIWVGSSNNVAIIPASGKNYLVNQTHFSKILKNSAISKIICDEEGNIWIGAGNGLYLSKADKNITNRINNIKHVKGFENILINALYQDKQGNIWVGENGSIYTVKVRGESTNKPIIRNHYKDIFKDGTQTMDISDITSDLSGNLWISTRNAGIFRCNYTADGNISLINKYNTKQPFCNISENMVHVLFVDLSNTLWIGYYRNGANYFNLSNKNFYSFNPLLSGRSGDMGYKGKFITTVIESKQNLWIGTYEDGLYQYNKCSRKLINYRTKMDSKNIICLYQSADNTVWVGGDKGLYRLAPDGSLAQTLFNGIAIRSICEDKYGRLWIATWKGINIYQPVNKSISNIDITNGLSSNTCFTLYADPIEKVIWVGTIGGGLNRIEYSDTARLKFNHYLYQANNKTSISNNHVWCIYRDNKKVLWIGTDAGLNKCLSDDNKNSPVFEPVTSSVMKDRKITSILEDDESNLWLSSSQGLFRFNTMTGNAKQYTYKDGLQSNNFTEAGFKNSEGRMYFGGINGLNYFEPEKIQSNPFLPSTAIIDFKIFNHSVIPGEKLDDKVILQNNINATNEITLSYKQNNFLLSFAALHYAVPEDNRFKYKLQGYDKDWIITGHEQRFAAYSNLDAGEYTFLLTSSNNDDVWSSAVKSIKIIIEPAPWFTWWAKTIDTFIIAILVWFIFNYFKAKHHFKNELYLEKIEKEKITELNELKLSFFTNITHELRTPLNLITGPIQELISNVDKYDKFTRFRLRLVHRNSSRLLSLIDQVLDLRKISSDTQMLMVTENELVTTIYDIVKSFNWLAEQKQVDFEFNYHPSVVHSWFDKDKIEKIIFNLLSNAFKYITDKGKIKVDLTLRHSGNPEHAQIIVTDSGPGIPTEEHENIFNLFYQGKKQEGAGNGIGLALCRKLTELHHGYLRVESEEGKGASFILSFPIEKKAYETQEIFKQVEIPSPNEAVKSPLMHVNESPEPINSDIRKTILLIEDDYDQRAYIEECLSNEFDIKVEDNALKGFETAVKAKPDIIILDIMMPGMTGIALSKKLKSDIRTLHIPVIIHSIKNSGAILQEALEAGADDIVPKPFDYHLLSIKINNIICSRKSLLKSTYKEQLTQPAVISIPSEEEELLKTILTLVEENMSDPGFGVEKLARLVAMSRMNLHRKLHTFTGKTASELIREIRIKRAGQLLNTGSMRISEVMYEIGISSNYHFNKYFKEMYGMTAKEYIKNNEK